MRADWHVSLRPARPGNDAALSHTDPCALPGRAVCVQHGAARQAQAEGQRGTAGAGPTRQCAYSGDMGGGSLSEHILEPLLLGNHLHALTSGARLEYQRHSGVLWVLSRTLPAQGRRRRPWPTLPSSLRSAPSLAWTVSSSDCSFCSYLHRTRRPWCPTEIAPVMRGEPAPNAGADAAQCREGASRREGRWALTPLASA